MPLPMIPPDTSVEWLLFLFIIVTVIVMVVRRRMMRSPTESEEKSPSQDSPLPAAASSVPYEPEPICDPDEKKAVMAKVEALEAEWNECGTPLLDDGYFSLCALVLDASQRFTLGIFVCFLQHYESLASSRRRLCPLLQV